MLIPQIAVEITIAHLVLDDHVGVDVRRRQGHIVAEYHFTLLLFRLSLDLDGKIIACFATSSRLVVIFALTVILQLLLLSAAIGRLGERAISQID